MKKINRFIIASVVVMAILIGSVIVNAQDIVDKQPTLWEKIIAFLRGTGTFSIVGQARHCDVYPTQEWILTPNQAFQRTQSNCLFDVFVENYIPFREYKNSVNILCGSARTQCIVQMYCNCDPECPSTPCPSGSNCITSTATDPYIPLDFTSWNYCSEPCAGPAITCWRVEGSSCVSRTYSCGYETYPNCPTSYPYTSQSQCQSHICTPNCAGKVCGANGCGGSCGNCPAGQTCNAEGQCISGTTPTCSDGIQNQGETGIDCGGPCSACSSGSPNFQIDITDWDPVVSSDSNVNVQVKIKNNGGSGTMKVEVGLYKTKDIISWGFAIVNTETNCEPLEKNVATKSITLDVGEETTQTFTFIAPKVCQSGTEIQGYSLLSVAFVNCKNTGLTVGMTGSDKQSIMFNPRQDCIGSCTNGIHDGDESDTDCGGYTCEKRCINGWKCIKTSDCQSGLVCTEGYCSPENTGRGNQKGILASKINEMTAEDLAASACSKTIQCESGSECKPTQYLIDEGYLTTEEAKSIIDKSAIFFTSAGAVGGIGACIAGAAALAIPTAGVSTILFPLCGLAGGALGLGIDEIFDKFTSKDYSLAGYCIKTGSDFLSYFEWAAWFDITGDEVKDGMDGLIICIIGGAILVLLLKRW